jgi:hypothetical protein
MNVLARARAAIGERDWIMTTLSVLAVVVIGVVAGLQYVAPDKRILGVSAAVVLFGVAWRLNLVSALGLLIVFLPFPRHTSFGSTNLAFILLLLVIWLLRTTQRQAPGPRRTPLDAPIATLILAYVISFYNVDNTLSLERALTKALLFLGCVLMFFLIVHNVRRVQDLKRFHMFQVAAVCLLYAFALWELAFPGHQLIPGWIDLSNVNVALATSHTYRVSGPWLDYELLSEYCAINLLFFVFLIAQSRSMTRRVLFTGLLLLSALILFSTVTRGGISALAAGLLYLMYRMRRRIQVVPITIIAVIATAVVIGFNFYLSHYTVAAGGIFQRFSETKFVNGLPDSRAAVWPQAFERMMMHPLIGAGPYYSAERGLKLWFWPHNLVLFIGNCFGLFGLGVFSWMIWKFWKLSTPETDRLDDPDYAKAFLLVARAQLVVFLVDEMKIEYLRNSNYEFQPWVMFAGLTSAYMILHGVENAVPGPVRATIRRPLASRA